MVDPIDLDSEVEAWNLVSELAEKALEKYTTTLEEDFLLLDHPKEFSYNHLNCIKLRSQDKQILHFFKNTAQTVKQISEMKQTDFGRTNFAENV